jgi:pimeloyl-ACP methyl ester carboxylesterase
MKAESLIVPRALPIMLAIMLAIVSSLLMADRAEARAWPIPDSAEVTVMSPDSLELVGYLYVPKGTKNARLPLVVLLHQTAESHGVWGDFPDIMCSANVAVFSLDLRGYGYSIYDFRTRKNRPMNTFYIGEQQRYPDDIRLMMKRLFALHGSKLDSTRIAVVGAELGGNAGLLYAADEPSVRLTVMISPGLEYSGLQIAKALSKYGSRPLHLVTSKHDIYSMESLNLMSDISPRILDIEVIESIQYGNALLNSEPLLFNRLSEMVVQALK